VFGRIAEFTVHSASLWVNSAGLSAKLAGWGFHCSNFESNGFRPVFTEFYQIRPIFPKIGGIGGSRFFSLRRFFKHCRSVRWRPGRAEAWRGGGDACADTCGPTWVVWFARWYGRVIQVMNSSVEVILYLDVFYVEVVLGYILCGGCI
jgi:hypothetical protein